MSMLYEEWFHCTDLGTQLVPIIMRSGSVPCYMYMFLLEDSVVV